MTVRVYSSKAAFRPREPFIRRAAQIALRSLGVTHAELNIYLVGDEVMKKNVLAFEPAVDFPDPEARDMPLGEIFLNPWYIAREKSDLIYMCIHGILHLVGFNHMQRTDRMQMEKEEARLLLLIYKKSRAKQKKSRVSEKD